MKFRNIFTILIVAAGTCLALVQFDTRGYRVYTAEKFGGQALKRRVWNFTNNAYLSGDFSKNFSVYLKHRMDGSTVHMAMPETVIPLDNHVALGFLVGEKVTLHTGISNDILGRADEIRPIYFPGADSVMMQKSLTSINVRMEANSPKVEFLFDASFFTMGYDLIHDSDQVLSSVEGDLITEIDFTIKPNEDIGLGIGTFLKNDFNSNGDFDYGDHYVKIEGDHVLKFRPRKLYLTWRVSEHYRISQELHNRGNAEGLATVFYLRPVFKMKKKVYIKGIARLDLSSKMRKQFYEIMWRKTIKKNSSIDFSYWNVAGSVFPRQGTRVKTLIFLGKVGFSPEFQHFWRMDLNGNYRHYRRSFNFETLFNVINRMDIILGYNYTNYKNLKPFTKRRSIYLGLRRW